VIMPTREDCYFKAARYEASGETFCSWLFGNVFMCTGFVACLRFKKKKKNLFSKMFMHAMLSHMLVSIVTLCEALFPRP